jgi:serine protease inhibitor
VTAPVRKSLAYLAAISALSFGILPVTAQQSPPDTTSAAHQADSVLAAAQAKLAWSLIQMLGAPGGESDVTVSPASLASALAIVSLGDDPTLNAAIAKVLGFGPDNANDLGVLFDVRDRLASAGDSFHSANLIVFAPSSTPTRLAREGLEHLGIDFAVADLSKPKAAAEIDALVKKITEGAIPEILGGPVEDASLVALNAMHFRGKWESPFDPQLTERVSFKGGDGKSADVAMMRLSKAKRSFRQEHNFIAVDLPFTDHRFSLVVVTTEDRPAHATEFAEVTNWLTGAGFADHSGDLALPRFSASAREELMPMLDALGLDKARHTATALQGLAPMRCCRG